MRGAVSEFFFDAMLKFVLKCSRSRPIAFLDVCLMNHALHPELSCPALRILTGSLTLSSSLKMMLLVPRYIGTSVTNVLGYPVCVQDMAPVVTVEVVNMMVFPSLNY